MSLNKARNDGFFLTFVANVEYRLQVNKSRLQIKHQRGFLFTLIFLESSAEAEAEAILKINNVHVGLHRRHTTTAGAGELGAS